ncbi:MAG: hypothetical protein AAGG48_13955 [Planctomycetota bacterium]
MLRSNASRRELTYANGKTIVPISNNNQRNRMNLAAKNRALLDR